VLDYADAAANPASWKLWLDRAIQSGAASETVQ
jgi:hypothetical protein